MRFIGASTAGLKSTARRPTASATTTPVEYEIRPITIDEIAAFVRTEHAPFGEHASDEIIEELRPAIIADLDRTLAVLEGDRIVATTGAWAFELSLPGGTRVPVPGVTAVAVLATHRRRGILRALMTRQLADVRERGEALAVLNASESSIYGRFGYGVATHAATITIDTRDAAFTRPVDDDGRIRLIDGKEAGAVFPAVHERYLGVQAGEVARPPHWWDQLFLDPEREREGASALFFAIHERAGECDGYAWYRTRKHWKDGLHDHTLELGELVTLDPRVRLAMWRFLLDVDLMERVTAPNFPVDEPLRWVLADPRRLRVSRLGDWLWVRLLDIPTALAARRYALDGGLVVEVADAFVPECGGRYRLDAGPDGASCTRADTAEPDLAMTVDALGAAYLGGVRFSTLARAGLVEEQRAGALARADALFATDPLPYCNSEF
jgi:predicted acetyltransferase